MSILNFGSLNIDYTYHVPRLVRPGETVASTCCELNCGGKGLNQSIALARSGAQVWHAGAVGADDGGLLLDALKKAGVQTELIRNLPSCNSGHAIIQVDEQGENCILLYAGANNAVTKEQADDVLSRFSAGDLLVLQNEISELPYIMERARDRGLRIALNPSPMDEVMQSLSPHSIDYLILNEVEASSLCGNAGDPLEDLHTRFPAAKILLTLGSRGVRYWNGSRELRHAAYQVPIVDTTGAGDTFTGFFLGSLSQGLSEASALERASKAAALAISTLGAGASIPTREAVEASCLKLRTDDMQC